MLNCKLVGALPGYWSGGCVFFVQLSRAFLCSFLPGGYVRISSWYEERTPSSCVLPSQLATPSVFQGNHISEEEPCTVSGITSYSKYLVYSSWYYIIHRSYWYVPVAGIVPAAFYDIPGATVLHLGASSAVRRTRQGVFFWFNGRPCR